MRVMTHHDRIILLPSAANFMRRRGRVDSIGAKRLSRKSQRGQDRFAGQARIGFEGWFDDFTKSTNRKGPSIAAWSLKPD